jgi:anti-sigma regulatory factor (Ser/Thr protein kinase)
VADDAILILSEFCTNAVLHSLSQGRFFTVRTELSPGWLLLSVEDLGGEWVRRLPDEQRPHGLNIVEIVAGLESWGIDGDERGHVVWARLGVTRAR